MKIRFFLMALLFQTILSCKKSDDPSANAQIIAFNPEKCYCCWGWVIKKGSDTIKVDNLPSVFIGADFPVNIRIELGEKMQECSGLSKYDYYKVKSVERIK